MVSLWYLMLIAVFVCHILSQPALPFPSYSLVSHKFQGVLTHLMPLSSAFELVLHVCLNLVAYIWVT
jgi:hypothetical protein